VTGITGSGSGAAQAAKRPSRRLKDHTDLPGASASASDAGAGRASGAGRRAAVVGSAAGSEAVVKGGVPSVLALARQLSDEVRYAVGEVRWRLTNVQGPTIKGAGLKSRGQPDNLAQMRRRGEMIFHSDLRRINSSAPPCDQHMRTARALARRCFDETPESTSFPPVPGDRSNSRREEFTTIGARKNSAKTVSRMRSRLARRRSRFPAGICREEFRFMGGDSALAAGEAMLEAARQAVQRRAR